MKNIFDENMGFRDQSHTGPSLRGALTGVDPQTGEVLWQRKNLVVRLGREFALRKIFSLPFADDLGSVSNLHARSVCLFGLGSGGAPAGDPFNPISPTPSDLGLSNAIPFRISTPSNPLTAAEALKYTNSVEQANGSFYWYLKTFSVDPTITNLVDSDEVFASFVLAIEALDARDLKVNELALYSAQQSLNGSGNVVFSNPKIFSRITFDTESFTTVSGKAQNIYYSIYA